MPSHAPKPGHRYIASSTSMREKQRVLPPMTRWTTCANFPSYRRVPRLWNQYLKPFLGVHQLHPDKATPSDDEEMDVFIDTNSGGFEVFTGDEDQEVSEVGRVRSDPINDNRYAPY
ncbi:hypothetical protein DFH07DRAFT_1035071 [Mycena maculata]|uniref:Uncharacterized protein n=1 Tax=Mycena maculata TaxID=230809 RepID=A0AAD7IRY7_9AGAR|nr:hypothetical protein DFH07DRAFT_1035071 [Mycena maculata]